MSTPHAPRATDDDLALARDLFAILPAFGRIAGRAAQSCDLGSPERCRLLLGLKNGPTRAGLLAQHSKLSPPAITEAVEGLERDGLVHREPDPDDRRGVIVALTPEGRRQLQRFEHAAAAAVAEAFASLDAAKRQRLRAALADLRAALASSTDMKEIAHAR